MDIFFGTTSPSKLTRIQGIVEPLGITVLWPKDFNITQDVEEDGQNELENAVIKAKAYFDLLQQETGKMMSVLAIDNGLYIEKFPEDKQPGPYVRRADGKELNDEELLDYYLQELRKVGGESPAMRRNGIALILSANDIRTTNIEDPTYLVSTPSEKKRARAPLASIQYDQKTKKYKSELTKEEQSYLLKHFNDQLFEFFKENL